MTNSKNIPINTAQAEQLIRVLQAEVVILNNRGNQLINRTNNRRAGANVLETAAEVQALVEVLEAEFPEAEDD